MKGSEVEIKNYIHYVHYENWEMRGVEDVQTEVLADALLERCRIGAPLFVSDRFLSQVKEDSHPTVIRTA